MLLPGDDTAPQGQHFFCDMESKCCQRGDVTCRDADGEAASSLKQRPTEVQIGDDTRDNWFRTKRKRHQQVFRYFGGISHSFDKEDKMSFTFFG